MKDISGHITYTCFFELNSLLTPQSFFLACNLNLRSNLIKNGGWVIDGANCHTKKVCVIGPKIKTYYHKVYYPDSNPDWAMHEINPSSPTSKFLVPCLDTKYPISLKSDLTQQLASCHHLKYLLWWISQRGLGFSFCTFFFTLISNHHNISIKTP